MKLWFIIELLLFFVLLAFASARSVGKQENVAVAVTTASPVEAVAAVVTVPTVAAAIVEEPVVTTPAAPVAPIASEAVQNITDPNSPSRFCKCAKLECNCCRDFRLPIVPISSSGCASLQYLKGDKMALTMKLGDAVIRNITISSRKNKPACVNLPGGFSQFCGRVYGISRQDETFRACLGLELRALADLEASLRVSCFRFSPTGVTMEPAPPLPAIPAEEEDDDDDDDFFGFGGFGGDDEDSDEEGIFGDDDEEYKDNDDNDSTVNDVSDETEDYPGLFGGIFDSFFEETPDSGNKKKKKPTIVKHELPIVANDKIDLIVEEAKPVVNKVVSTTERQPTTIVLSPTSSVTVTMSEATTKRAPIPDPIKQSEETKEEDDEEEEEEEAAEDEEEEDDDDDDFDIELDDDDDETTESNDSDTLSSELAEAIKGVEEELSNVGDIEVEDSSDEEATPKPASASVEVSSTTESEDEDLDILGAVEELAEEVAGTDKDEAPPQIGVAMNGEPRMNTTEKAPLKRINRVSRVSRYHA